MDLNQTKPKPRPDDVPVGNIKRESGAVTESIRPKTIEKRPRDRAKEFGDLEFRWSLDKELVKNPIARLGFKNLKGTDKVADFNDVEGYVDYIMSTPNLKKDALNAFQINNENELKEELLSFYSAIPEMFDNATYFYSENTPSQTKAGIASGNMAIPRNRADETLPDDIFVDTDVASPRVWAHEMTHRGFDRLIEYKNQIGDEEFVKKYGQKALSTLEQIGRSSGSNEFFTEYFDFVDDTWNYPNRENMGRGDKEKFLDSNTVKDIEKFQSEGPGIYGKKNPQYGGLGYLVQAAEDILKEVEPPKATPYGHLSFMGRLRKKFGFDEGGLAENKDLDLARSYGVTVVDPEETSQTVKALGKAAIESIPGISTATTIRDIKEELQEEDPSLAKIGMLAASEAVGMIPGLGQVGKTIIRKTSTKLVDKAADAKEAERLIKDSEALEQWRKENKLPESQRQKNPEGSKKAASDLLEGEITSKEARQRIKDFIPDPQEFTAEQVLDMMPSLTQITGALGKKAKKYPIIGVKGKDLDKGQVVSSRLDIPAYDDYDTWVVSIHDGNQKSGSVVGYGQAIRLKNINFGSDPKTALDIARGKRLVQATGEDAPKPQGKATIARIFGEYQPEDPYDLQRQAAEIIASGSEEWTQIGMNPYRGSAFYNKKTGAPVFEADEIIQVGPLVLAKNVKKPTISQMKQMAVRTRDGRLRMFNEGGVAMNEQMEMAFMQQGGIKDDGMNKDPVSGNPIPPGSMASEVRDDIPAMLSEGEYVVPADVLRFYGVNFFENLRGQAKSGLQNMEKNGRIGGEPLSQQQIQQNMGQSGVTMQANQGGAVGYYGGGGAIPDTYMDQAKALNPKPFDASQFSTVGGSTFSSNPQAEANSITRTETYINAETNDTRIVRFVSSGSETKIVPESDVQYTRPPYYLQGSSALKKAQQAVPTGGGGSDPKDPPESKPKQPFGIDVDWSDPKAYADSLLEGPDGLPKSIQMLSALGGPFTMGITGTGNAAMTLGKISDLRAAKIVAQAQGDTSTSEYIDKELGKFIKRSPNIVSFLEKAVAPGTSKAKEVLDRLGLDYEEDKKGNITFTERMQELNNRILRETRMFSAAGRKELMTQFEKDRFSGDGKPNVYRPGGIDVALGQGSSSDKDYNAAQAASRAAAAARRAAMQEAQAAGGSSDDIADLKEKYEEAGGTWASGGRAEGGLMTKAKKKKKIIKNKK